VDKYRNGVDDADHGADSNRLRLKIRAAVTALPNRVGLVCIRDRIRDRLLPKSAGAAEALLSTQVPI